MIVVVALAAVVVLFLIAWLVVGLVFKLLWWALIGLVIGALARAILPGRQTIGALERAGAGRGAPPHGDARPPAWRRAPRRVGRAGGSRRPCRHRRAPRAGCSSPRGRGTAGDSRHRARRPRGCGALRPGSRDRPQPVHRGRRPA